MGIIIRNAVLLDLTNATEDVIKEIKRIDNVVCMLYSEKTKHLVKRLNIKNIVRSLEVPQDIRFINGSLELDKSFLNGIAEPVFLYVESKVIIKPDVSTEDMEKAIAGIIANGRIYCPKRISGVLQKRADYLNGRVAYYMDDAVLVNDDLNMDERYLAALEPATNLTVTGTIRMTGDIKPSLLEDRLGAIEALGNMIIREEYLDLVHKKLQTGKNSRIEIIPAGYVYIDKELVLDAITIKKYDRAKIYTTKSIRFDEDITIGILQKHISSIQTKSSIICRKELREAVLDICGDSAARILDYTGRLLIVDTKHRLTQGELQYTKGKITMIVHGSLEIDKDIHPDVLDEKLEWIDNFGEIICSSEQYGLIQTKLRTRSGEVVDRDMESAKSTGCEKDGLEEKSDDTCISNGVYLKF